MERVLIMGMGWYNWDIMYREGKEFYKGGFLWYFYRLGRSRKVREVGRKGIYVGI